MCLFLFDCQGVPDVIVTQCVVGVGLVCGCGCFYCLPFPRYTEERKSNPLFAQHIQPVFILFYGRIFIGEGLINIKCFSFGMIASMHYVCTFWSFLVKIKQCSGYVVSDGNA